MAVLAPSLDPEQPTGLLFGEGFAQVNEDLAVTSPYTGEPVAAVAVGAATEAGRPLTQARSEVARARCDPPRRDHSWRVGAPAATFVPPRPEGAAC